MVMNNPGILGAMRRRRLQGHALDLSLLIDISVGYIMLTVNSCALNDYL